MRKMSNMRTYLLWLGLWIGLGGLQGWAQPYSGGAGDGYDQVQALLVSSLEPGGARPVWVGPQPLHLGQNWQIGGLTGSLHWELWDAQGRRCAAGEAQGGTLLPCPAVAPGLYWLRLRSRAGTWHLPLAIYP